MNSNIIESISLTWMPDRMFLANESETVALTQKISSLLSNSVGADIERADIEVGPYSVGPPWILFLEGDLGAGKTTFVRGLLRGLGYQGIVKSPTYTLMESYSIQAISILHLDLYRLNSPQELLSIGLNDYLKERGIICIEWPEKGGGFLPAPDLKFGLRSLAGCEEGRALSIQFCSKRSFIFKEVLS